MEHLVQKVAATIISDRDGERDSCPETQAVLYREYDFNDHCLTRRFHEQHVAVCLACFQASVAALH
jgi:hypothetical protein